MISNRAFLAYLMIGIGSVYAPGLLAPPSYDDVGAILENPRLSHPDPTSILRSFVDPLAGTPRGTPPYGYVYRPLAEATFALNGALTGSSIVWMRVGNLALHGLSSWLVFLIARRFCTATDLRDMESARWAAIWFALHPLAVHGVTYVYQRSVALEVVLSLATLLLYLSGREAGRSWMLMLAWVTGLLAMGSKETAICLPLMLLVLELVLWNRGEPWLSLLKRWLPFSVLPAAVLIQVIRSQHAQLRAGILPLAEEAGFTSTEYLMVELPIVLHYVRLALWPFPLYYAHDRGYPRFGTGPQPALMVSVFSGVLLLAGLVWIFWGPRRHRWPRLGLGLFLAPLALESSIFPIQDVARLYRCYPGLLGGGLVFAGISARLPRGFRWAVLLLLGIVTAGENLFWEDTMGLYARDVRTAPHNPVNWGNYAERYLKACRFDHAEAVARHALCMPPAARVYAVHAQACLALGRLVQAHEDIQRVEKLFPDELFFLRLALNRAVQEGDQAEVDRLARLLREHESLDALSDQRDSLFRSDPERMFRLAQHWLDTDHPDLAERLLRRNRDLFEGNVRYWEVLGTTCLAQGRLEESEQAYRRALDLDASRYTIHNNLGMIHVWRRELPAAEASFREATRLGPGSARAWRNLADLLERTGRTTEAQEARGRAGSCPLP